MICKIYICTIKIGQKCLIPYFGGRLAFQVLGVIPKNSEAVIVTPKTLFQIEEKTKSLRGVPLISYEDIGGLTVEVKKIKEMNNNLSKLTPPKSKTFKPSSL